MPCTKYSLNNPNNFPIVFSYQECTSLVWWTNQILYPNQTKKIWFRNGTFSSASVNLPLPSAIPFPITPSQGPITVEVTSCCTGDQMYILTNPGAQIGFTYVIDGVCYSLTQLNVVGRVTPTVYTATYDNCSSCLNDNTCPTPTPTRTPTPTPSITSSNTPTPTTSITNTPTSTPNPTSTPTTTPTVTPSTTISSTPTNTPTPTQTRTPQPTPTPTSSLEFCADVKNGNFDQCNPVSSITSVPCNCYTGGSPDVTNYDAGCIPFWTKGDTNDKVTIWSNTTPYYSGTTYLELNGFVSPPTPPSPTPTTSLETLGVYVSVDSSLPSFSGTVWYSVNPTPFDPTEPFPLGLTWTQLGSTVLIPQCNSSLYVGDIGLNLNEIAYIQIRNESGTCLYKQTGGIRPSFEPCTYSGFLAPLYTQSATYQAPGSRSIGLKVVSPIQKTASPYGFPWIYQDINITNVASPYSIQFGHLGRSGYANTMRAGISGNTTGMQFFTGEFTGSTSGWTTNTINGYVFNASDTQRRLVFSSTTCDDGGNFIDGVIMDCQSFAVSPTPTSSVTPTPTVTPSVTPSCAQSVFIFIPNL